MKMVFLSGFARSGTSWLLKIFAAHPEVLCHYEPFNLASQRKRLPENLRFWGALGQLRKMVEAGELEEAQRRFAKPLDRFWKVRDHALDREPFFDQPQEGGTMVIKEDFSWIPEVVAAYGPVIQIVRDPRALVNSLWNHTRFGRHYGAQSTAERWAEANSRLLELQEKQPERYRVVAYEELVDRPVEMSKELLEFAGIDWAPEVGKFLAECHKRHDPDPYQVYKDPKKARDGWRSKLSPATQKLVLDAVRGSRAAKELYDDFPEGE